MVTGDGLTVAGLMFVVADDGLGLLLVVTGDGLTLILVELVFVPAGDGLRLSVQPHNCIQLIQFPLSNAPGQ